MKDKRNLKKAAIIFYWAALAALLVLFFTNDYGLVDIHKTSFITAIAIDIEEEEVQVTANIGVPQPSQGGENVQYTQVQGSGLTVADALNEINAKTGFEPKLLFCKIILVGESCRNENLFKVLGCLYRRNFPELTSYVAACKGKAADFLSKKTAINPETHSAIEKILSDELKKSANASTVTLKDIAYTQYSKSKACYLPLLEMNAPGTSENGGNGDNVGGEDVQGGSSGGSQQGGGSSQQGGGESGQSGGGQSGQSGQGGGQEEQVEFTARSTAIYSDGEYKGVLQEAQSFALDILLNEIRLAMIQCDVDGVHYTMGLRNAKGGVDLKFKDGQPQLDIDFKAIAQIRGYNEKLDPATTAKDQVVPKEILEATQQSLKERFESLVKQCVEADCDVLGTKELLYGKHTKYFETYKDDLLQKMTVNYKIEVKSLN